MTRGAPIAIVVLSAITLAACESSQTRSARLRAAAGTRKVEKGLTIARDNPGVRVASTTLLTDAKASRSAAVVELRNTSQHPLAGLPLLFTVTGAGGKKLFSNDSPGASPDLTTVPSLAPGDTLDWVNDAIINVTGGQAVAAHVGEPAKPVAQPAAATPMRLEGVKLDSDPVDGTTVTGRVVNPTSTTQERLVIFATARRGDKLVAAGRAVVPVVKPGGKGTRFTIFFVGDPRGAKLKLQAPAVSLGSAP